MLIVMKPLRNNGHLKNLYGFHLSMKRVCFAKIMSSFVEHEKQVTIDCD